MLKQEVTKRLPVKRFDRRVTDNTCSVIATLKLFATRWKPCILCYLGERPMRYTELYALIPNISRKMLSEHLKEMESQSLIIRTQYDPKRQKVEYSLTERGHSLRPLLEQLQDWGMQHLDNVLTIKEMVSITMEPKLYTSVQ